MPQKSLKTLAVLSYNHKFQDLRISKSQRSIQNR